MRDTHGSSMKKTNPPSQLNSQLESVRKISVIGLADSLYEMYTLKELERRCDMLVSFIGYNPEIKKLKLFNAIFLALEWKRMEEARCYQCH